MKKMMKKLTTWVLALVITSNMAMGTAFAAEENLSNSSNAAETVTESQESTQEYNSSDATEGSTQNEASEGSAQSESTDGTTDGSVEENNSDSAQAETEVQNENAEPIAPTAPEKPEAPEMPNIEGLSAEEANELISNYNTAVDEYNAKAEAYNTDSEAYEAAKSDYNEKAAAYNLKVEEENAEAEIANQAEAEKENEYNEKMSKYQEKLNVYNKNVETLKTIYANNAAKAEQQKETFKNSVKADKETIWNLGTVLEEDVYIGYGRYKNKIGNAGDLAIKWDDLTATADNKTITVTESAAQSGSKYKVANLHIYEDFKSYNEIWDYYDAHGYDCMNINIDDASGTIIIPAKLIDHIALLEYEVAEPDENDTVEVTNPSKAISGTGNGIVKRYFENYTEGAYWTSTSSVFQTNAANSEYSFPGQVFSFDQGTVDNQGAKNTLNTNYYMFAKYSNPKPVAPETFTPNYRTLKTPLSILGTSVADYLNKLCYMDLIQIQKEEAEEEDLTEETKEIEAENDLTEEEKKETESDKNAEEEASVPVIPAAPVNPSTPDGNGTNGGNSDRNTASESVTATQASITEILEAEVPAAAPAAVIAAPAQAATATTAASTAEGNAETLESEESAEAVVIAADETETAEILTDIEETEVPLAAVPAAAKSGSWALINLICTLLSAIAALGMILSFFRKSESENEDGEEEKKHKVSKLAGIIPAAASVILFILTEDMTNPMQMTDRWTILMAVLLLANIILAAVTRNKRNSEEETDAAMQTA